MPFGPAATSARRVICFTSYFHASKYIFMCACARAQQRNSCSKVMVLLLSKRGVFFSCLLLQVPQHVCMYVLYSSIECGCGDEPQRTSNLPKSKFSDFCIQRMYKVVGPSVTRRRLWFDYHSILVRSVAGRAGREKRES